MLCMVAAPNSTCFGSLSSSQRYRIFTLYCMLFSGNHLQDPLKEFGIEKRISDRPHVMLWLVKTYALSAGMYASQIWSTQFLKHDNGFSNPLQVAHMAFLKRILGIKSTSANWCVL